MESITRAPFFVIGCQRSGTTLLRLMLNSHSEIAIPEEGTFWMPLLRRYGRHQGRGIGGIELETCLRYVIKNRQFQLWQFDPEETVRKLKSYRRCSLSQIVATFYEDYARSVKKNNWGDKTPSFFRMVPLLAGLFPEAKFIHVVRDGRDVYLSWRKLNPARKNVAVAAMEWRYKTMKAEMDLDRIGAKRTFQIRYEDLVRHPQSSLERACEFLRVEFEPAMLEFWKTSERFVGAHHSDLICSPISTESVEKWKTKMSNQETMAFQLLAGSILERLGYERVSDVDGPGVALLYTVLLLTLGIPARLLKVGYTAFLLSIASRLGLGTDKAGKGSSPDLDSSESV